MATNYSPKIVTDGLVLYYDKANVKKSWKGKPTTNLQPDLGLNVFNAITGTYLGVEDGWKKYSLNGTWASGTYPYSMSVTGTSFTGGEPYSTGVYIKSNVMHKFATKFTGMNYVNQPQDLAGTSFSIAQPDGSVFVGRKGFQYTATTSQTGYLLSKPLADGTVFTAATDFVWIKEGQIEAGLINTPYVNGTRTNTQAIEDLTGNNTITATSLTYTQDDFEFDGTADKMLGPTGGNLDFGSSPFTVSFICKKTAAGFQGGSYINKGLATTTGWGTRDSDFYVHSSLGTIAQLDMVATQDVYQEHTFVVNQSDSSIIRHYVNGVLDQTGYSDTVANKGSVTNTREVEIGYSFAGGVHRYFNGDLPVVKMYNKALTADEVEQNFNATRARFGI